MRPVPLSTTEHAAQQAAPEPRVGPTLASIPNALTLARVAMTVAFVALLSAYRLAESSDWIPLLAAILFAFAAATDALDGYLARRWRVVSVFGRIMDPLADKVLVLGAFVLLAGPAFAQEGRQVSGVLPWMAVVILARELLVTSLRSVLEARGVDFSAKAAGKWKMILQSLAVPAILLLVALADPEALAVGWARWTVDLLVWITVAATAISAWPYVAAARRAIASGGEA